MNIYKDTSLLGYNTFRMNVRAKVLVEYASIDELKSVLSEYRNERLLHIGQGSNLLFTKDFSGVVLRSLMCRACALEETKDYVFIEAQNGLLLDSLIEQVCAMGLSGMENLSHIPGTVGASAVQNVGAYGVEAKDVIQKVCAIEVATGKERVFSNAECHYDYRDSVFKNELQGQYIVTSVVYRLEKNGRPSVDKRNDVSMNTNSMTPLQVREEIIRIRQSKLPEIDDLGSAGSFFKNPVIDSEHFRNLAVLYPAMPNYKTDKGVKIPAAWLIEQCGWKGKSVGGAQVYQQQPLVIVNATGKASAQDIISLAEQISDSVKEKFGITLVPEVNYI